MGWARYTFLISAKGNIATYLLEASCELCAVCGSLIAFGAPDIYGDIHGKVYRIWIEGSLGLAPAPKGRTLIKTSGLNGVVKHYRLTHDEVITLILIHSDRGGITLKLTDGY